MKQVFLRWAVQPSAMFQKVSVSDYASRTRRRATSRITAGFTLIELLIVIAIILLLAAILFPVFAQARAKARQAACISNMKQIGLGIMQYTQDYDELLPGTVGDSQGQSI